MPFKPKPKPNINMTDVAAGRQFKLSHETREMQKPPEKITKHDSGKYKDSKPNVTHQVDIFSIPKARQRDIRLTGADKERFGGKDKVKAKLALIVQDVGTRKLDIKWIPNKTATATTNALKQIYKEGTLKRPTFRLMSDKGNEYMAEFKKFVEDDLQVRQVMKDSDYSHVGVVDRYIARFRTELNTQQNQYEAEHRQRDFNWEYARKEFVKDTNKDVKERFVPEWKETGKVLIEKEKHAEILPIGTRVKRYIQSDYIRDELGDLKKQVGKKRAGSTHWTRHNYVIVNVLLNPDSPPRYILKREGAGFKAENEDPVHYKHVKPLRVFRLG